MASTPSTTLRKKKGRSAASPKDAKASGAAAEASFSVTRSASTGRLVINGVDEAKLVNRHPKMQIQAAPGKPKHLSPAQISAMLKMMKVA